MDRTIICRNQIIENIIRGAKLTEPVIPLIRRLGEVEEALRNSESKVFNLRLKIELLSERAKICKRVRLKRLREELKIELEEKQKNKKKLFELKNQIHEYEMYSNSFFWRNYQKDVIIDLIDRIAIDDEEELISILFFLASDTISCSSFKETCDIISESSKIDSLDKMIIMEKAVHGRAYFINYLKRYA